MPTSLPVTWLLPLLSPQTLHLLVMPPWPPASGPKLPTTITVSSPSRHRRPSTFHLLLGMGLTESGKSKQASASEASWQLSSWAMRSGTYTLTQSSTLLATPGQWLGWLREGLRWIDICATWAWVSVPKEPQVFRS